MYIVNNVTKYVIKKIDSLFDFEILIFADRVMRLIIYMKERMTSYNTNPP